MKLQWIDIAILVTYLLSMLVIGWVMRKKARQSKDNYLNGWQEASLVFAGP